MALSSLPRHCRSGTQAVILERRTYRPDHTGRTHLWSHSMGPYIKLFASVQEAKLLAEWPLIEYKAYRPHSALIRTEAAKGVTPSHAPLNHFKKKLLARIKLNHVNA